jgi:predicted nucleotidyltransferase
MDQRKGTSKQIEELAKNIIPLLREGGVIEASVFGSFSRGEDKPESDLDRVWETIRKDIPELEGYIKSIPS